MTCFVLGLGSLQASLILGTGSGALRGSDLTDPENDIIDNTGDLPGGFSSGLNFNWVSVTSSDDRIYFGDPVAGGGRQGVLDVFDNEVGGDTNSKWCCNGPNTFGGALHVTVEFQQPVVLTHFTIASGNDAAWRRPTVWSMQGSNDGTNFTSIFAQNNPVSAWSANSQVILWESDSQNPTSPDFSTPLAYRFIRYEVTSTEGNGTNQAPGAQHQLEEIELFGNVVPEPSALGLLILGAVLLLRRSCIR